MASNTLDGLRLEINAAIEVLLPQIRGMEDLLKVSLSEATLKEVAQELDDHQRRLGLLRSVISALDSVVAALQALGFDGYPEMPKEEVSDAIYKELKEQMEDMQAALLEFTPQLKAVSMKIKLGAKSDKP